MDFVINLSFPRTVTRSAYLFGAFLFIFLTAQAQKTLRFEDFVYEASIRTVLCYPLATQGPPVAVVKLESQNLVLEFDDLQEEKNNYYARLVHCNYDWTKSDLRDLDILRDYNEFPINDYGFSINTDIPYVHYRFDVPRVKLPGNYLLIIFRDGNKSDLILTRRIMVFDGRIVLSQVDNISGLGNLRTTNQALNFQLNYGRTEIINPTNSIHVVLRQNQRWDNARNNVQPSFIREDTRQLEYRFFDMDNTFSAGNEFRFVDFRSLNSPGQNTQRIDRAQKPYTVYVAQDIPRNTQAYTQYPDRNGSFSIENLDNRQEPWISTNYVYVSFLLKSPKLLEEVFVLGAFNGWRLTGENIMTHSNGFYSQRILLKQGFYDYQYWVRPTVSSGGNQLEGNYFQTENLYDVLVYYRAFQPNADLLIGYFQLPANPR